MALQVWHISCRLTMESGPPRARGVMWSTVSTCSGSSYPQPAQRRFWLAYSSSLSDWGLTGPSRARSLRRGGSLWMDGVQSSQPRSSAPFIGICSSRRARLDSTSAACGRMSMPIHCRSSFSAAMQAVAQPQKGSSTKSPGRDDALMMRCSRASGFCVLQPVYSRAHALTGRISVQRLEGIWPSEPAR